VRLDAAFHVALADASGNRVIARLIEHLRELLIDQSIAVVQFEGRIGQANLEHREIFDAVAAQDPTAARRAMSGHLLNVYRI
jgi:GntR family transcriptional repressor for pyruvate dehydrogenase complex